MAYAHQPVMVDEVVRMLALKPGSTLIDGTAGGAGHIRANVPAIGPTGRILGIDLDPEAVTAAHQATKNDSRVTIVQGNYKNINQIAHVHKFNKVDGIVFDLGLSTDQLQDRKRGFSFSGTASLDMRFDPASALTAGEIIKTHSEKQLTELFKNYGEEALALPIAKAITAYRKAAPIETTETLNAIIQDIYQARYHGRSRTNPSTKVFQALRIATNDELGNVDAVLPEAIALLKPGGRLVVISFHSLEDRIVKNYFKRESRDCICPPKTPVCQCGHKKSIMIISKKPLVPSVREIADNPRARSAKMRVAEKI